MGPPEITAFLDPLTTERRSSASTQNQALCTVVFLCERVLERDMPSLRSIEPDRRPDLWPTVLELRDVLALPGRLAPPFRLMGEAFHGSRLRLVKGVSSRIKGMDLERRQVTVRQDR